MSRAAWSILIFGGYMAIEGLGLMLVPTFFTGLLGAPPPMDFWVRLLGIAFLVFALYYVLAARAELTAFFRFTVIGRAMQFVCVLGLMAAGIVGLPVLLGSVVELAAGIWTFLALRSDGRAAGRP